MPARSAPVLVYTPTGRDAAVAVELLRRAGINAHACADYAELLAGLDGAGVVVVAEEGLVGQPQEQLARWVEEQPPWSDLPFVMLTSQVVHERVAAWRQRQIERLGNVSLVERPLQPLTLVSVVRSALRARGRQLEVQSLLEAREAAAAGLEAKVEQRTAQLHQANDRLREEMERREHIEASLRHAQKMEALGQLTGGVAHDFNNLLMVISAGLEMLERSDEPERRKRFMGAMRQASDRGASLTRQLLTFSRRHAVHAATASLPALLGNMGELLDRSLRGDVDVDVRLAPDLWPVHVDAGEFEIAILNLAVNARDAMNGSGRITIRADNVVERGVDGEQEMVRLVVRDTGSGMSEEVKARVFEPFFTTKDVGKGSGLGLAQVYGFAQQSGGRVEIDSAPGRGTAITLLLPRSPHSLPDGQVARTVVAGPEAPPSRCVLLVEDDVEVASLVQEMLRAIGCDVVHAMSARAALGALANGRHIDLVFSDVMMPGGTSGIELAREVRRRRPGLPILLTSGFSDPVGPQAQALDIPVLRKPYALDDLREAVHQQLGAAPSA
ncbi:ATP-binding protein [Pseudoxanthomonas suwonensis]|uniref:ATP-binding protein n=1 Tax=Pseudoxanthomonas suwonensis TaxID=314722 RepID=UPI00138F07B4|nr:ATP-binding protein [Pseudoxanthomonas suwonensis]KAF1705602.1 hybrid sensor histidine kinase/response regulator [Pseudoxanthomonas suwonensis]